MDEIESVSESVDSGSCTCSDYNSDCSWFYDSRMLATSYLRFCIINDKDNIIIKKERSNNMFDQKSLNKINKINELKKDLNNENFSNKRRNVIKLSNSSSNIKNEKSEDASKSNDNNIIKYSYTRIKDKNSFDFIDNNINRSFIKDNNISSNFSKDTHSYLDIINLKRTNSNFFPENLNKYEHNYSAPIELINFHEKILIYIELLFFILIKEKIYLI